MDHSTMRCSPSQTPCRVFSLPMQMYKKEFESRPPKLVFGFDRKKKAENSTSLDTGLLQPFSFAIFFSQVLIVFFFSFCSFCRVQDMGHAPSPGRWP